ncbi:hypothetical protein STENM223S_00580 [Streptomyces tendae]
MPVSRRISVRRLAAVPSPLRRATTSKRDSPRSINRHARASRSPVSHASGAAPSCARKRRCRVAGLTAARSARPDTVSGESSRS